MSGKSLSEKIGELGRKWAIDAHAVWIAARDPATPIFARYLAFAVAAYALSPIDLIPDFIPIFGWIDDLLIVPLGLWAVRRMIPQPLWQRCHDQASAAMERPSSRIGMAMIFSLWAAALFLIYWSVRTASFN